VEQEIPEKGLREQALREQALRERGLSGSPPPSLLLYFLKLQGSRHAILVSQFWASHAGQDVEEF
jgi:hypothetical protein